MVAKADEAVAERMRKLGWNVLTKGWPDLLAYKPPTFSLRAGNGYRNADVPWYSSIKQEDKYSMNRAADVIAIELKRGSDKLRPEQLEMLSIFRHLLKVPSYVARDDAIKLLQSNQGSRFPFPATSSRHLHETAVHLNQKIDELQRQQQILQTQQQNLQNDLDKICPIWMPEKETELW